MTGAQLGDAVVGGAVVAGAVVVVSSGGTVMTGIVVVVSSGGTVMTGIVVELVLVLVLVVLEVVLVGRGLRAWPGAVRRPSPDPLVRLASWLTAADSGAWLTVTIGDSGGLVDERSSATAKLPANAKLRTRMLPAERAGRPWFDPRADERMVFLQWRWGDATTVDAFVVANDVHRSVRPWDEADERPVRAGPSALCVYFTTQRGKKRMCGPRELPGPRRRRSITDQPSNPAPVAQSVDASTQFSSL